jgi:hypothetical protein
MYHSKRQVKKGGTSNSLMFIYDTNCISGVHTWGAKVAQIQDHGSKFVYSCIESMTRL